MGKAAEEAEAGHPTSDSVGLDSEWLTSMSLLDNLPALDNQEDGDFTVEDLFPDLSVL